VLVFIDPRRQFRAWLPAILILLAAPLSLGGALLLLWATASI
jgi:multidrug efflux pump subunit AcrB